MAQCYKFAIVRFAPDDTRDERLNVGAVIFTKTGLDIRVSQRLQKVRVLSAAIDIVMLRHLIENLKSIDNRLRDSEIDAESRAKMLSRGGPLILSEAGTFVADDQRAYEARVASIMKAMVDPEPAPYRLREKRTKLLTQVKRSFNEQNVLAARGEGLESHRIVSRYELAPD